jgi:hypothetical protein
MTRVEGHELHAEGAYDKPRRGSDRERIFEKLQRFPSDIMACHWVARVLRMNASQPMVGCKGEQPQ